MTDYSQMTNEEFDDLLEERIKECTVAELLAIDGVGQILREEFNNDVLDMWVNRNPAKAGLEDDEED